VADKNGAMAFTNNPVSGWYTKNLGPANFGLINKSGITQFRLRFNLDDNNDLGADYLKFYSGNYATAVYRPQLIIRYNILGTGCSLLPAASHPEGWNSPARQTKPSGHQQKQPPKQ
jgi:hypothetical protein